MFVSAMCMQVPGEARRDFRSLGAGVKGSCELPNRNARDQTLVLWKSNQYYLLSHVSSSTWKMIFISCSSGYPRTHYMVEPQGLEP